jgi:ubiquinone/menaquinone biosynthesis C-methylase UbiE
MATERIYEAVARVIREHPNRKDWSTHLDVGPGAGELIRMFKDEFGVQSSACDYTDEMMKLPGQKLEIVDLNIEKLPYEDNRYDIVTATEVIEHLEQFREVLREMYRVTKPGGVCVLTTPNILNLNSRFRFLTFGFWNLFGPLPLKDGAIESIGGHINPVSFFYVAHALIQAGFSDVSVTVDKHQRSSLPKLVFAWPFIKFFAALTWRKETHRFKTIKEDNAPLVREINSLPMLLGRTIIVAARKPSS